MHPFYIILVLETILAFVFFIGSSSTNTRGKRTFKYRQQVYLILAFGILFYFHAFRDPYSLLDIPAYANAYKESLGCTWNRVLSDQYVFLKSEVGFRIVIKAISSIFSSYQMLFVLTSVFLTYSYYKTIKRYSAYFFISVMVFTVSSFADSLFMLRSFLAIGILLFTFPYIIERKIVPFLALSMLAMTIHNSSVIFLPVYFIYGVKKPKWIWMTLIVVGGLFMLGFDGIVSYIVERYLLGYSYYIDNIDNYEGASWKMPALLGSLLLMRVVVLKKNFFDMGITRLLSIISVLAFLVYTAGMGFGLTSRMAMFFTNMTFLILPDTVSQMKNKQLGIIISIVYIIFSSYFFLRNSTESLWVNYHLI